MSPLARRVLRSLRRRGLLTAEERVAIAVSGGSDSVALVFLLREIASAGDLTVAGLVHLNHGLRGQESNDDETFCRTLAARIGWPIVVSQVDAAALAGARSQSIESACRTARYRFFEDAMRELPADVVATGHTLDDQAETVLLRLLRGAGTRGLSGIRARRGPFVRPLLAFRRDELRQYLSTIDESFREDSSNQDLAIARNRVRHELMPVIARVAPAGPRALARLAALARDDDNFLQEAAIKASHSLVLSTKGARTAPPDARPGSFLCIDCRALAGLPPAVGRRVAREFLSSVRPAASLTSRHIEAVRELAAADKPNGHLDLPGLVVERQGDVLTICGEVRGGQASGVHGPSDAGRGLKERAGFHQPLDVPGVIEVPEAGVRIEASMCETPGRIVWSRDRNVALLQAASMQLPLAVRSRRPGDRFRPLGAPGRRKLQDVLTDRKIPRTGRDLVPIVVDAADRIVWVVGVAIAEECRVTTPESGVVILEVRDLRN
jgi:tRNA(Ile)-lysidine synthase